MVSMIVEFPFEWIANISSFKIVGKETAEVWEVRFETYKMYWIDKHNAMQLLILGSSLGLFWEYTNFTINTRYINEKIFAFSTRDILNIININCSDNSIIPFEKLILYFRSTFCFNIFRNWLDLNSLYIAICSKS